MSDLTVRMLFERHRERLGLRFLAAEPGASHVIRADWSEDGYIPLVGHLNLVRPHCVQVLGRAECEHLGRLSPDASDDHLRRLFAPHPACIIVADGLPASPMLRSHADATGTALLGSDVDSHKVVGDLQYYLSNHLARRVSVHGVFMELVGLGMLLTGQSGVGKSELALELISRGHRLIADDAPEFFLIAPDTLDGRCPPSIVDFMEVRGMGVVNIRAMFGDSAIKQSKYLRLILHLERMRDPALKPEERLSGIRHTRNILGVEVPVVTLPVVAGHNLAVLAECSARNHILRMKGYDAAEDFAQKQARLIAEQD